MLNPALEPMPVATKSILFSYRWTCGNLIWFFFNVRNGDETAAYSGIPVLCLADPSVVINFLLKTGILILPYRAVAF